jgi:hypothetical protein
LPVQMSQGIARRVVRFFLSLIHALAPRTLIMSACVARTSARNDSANSYHFPHVARPSVNCWQCCLFHHQSLLNEADFCGFLAPGLTLY